MPPESVPFHRRFLSSKTSILTKSAAVLLGAVAFAPHGFGADGGWTQAAAGTQLWSNSGNWAGGTIADGVDATAVFNTNLTADQTIGLEATGRTIGNLFFQDPDTASAGGFNVGQAGNGALNLDVTTGRSVIGVGALNTASGKKIS